MVILALASQDKQAGPPQTENSLTNKIDDIFVYLLDGFNNEVDCSQKAISFSTKVIQKLL